MMIREKAFIHLDVPAQLMLTDGGKCYPITTSEVIEMIKENEVRNKGCQYCEEDCNSRYCYNCGRKIEGGGIMDKIIRMRKEK